MMVFWISAVCFFYLTQVRIHDVSFDESSQWNKYFLSESGFSTIRIHSRVSSREYSDHISIVGADRPQAWFEQLGFEVIDDDRNGFVHTITKTLPDDGSSQRVVTMEHPRRPERMFFYLPRAGILMYHE